MTSEWDQRQLCADGGCTGVIGGDGTCKVCGRVATNWGDERRRGRRNTDEVEAEDKPAPAAVIEEAAIAVGALEIDDDLDKRQLCSDGSCIGVIGDDGKCKVCGRAATDGPDVRPARVTGQIMELVGGTPLVKLRVLPGDGAGEVWGKCEHWNPGGSVKDRIAAAMIDAAEQAGTIAPGRSTIVEPTSGNTGIGLALVCAARGYRLILTMPESMSLERRALLTSLRAELVLTPEADDMDGAVTRAHALCREIDGAFMPDQFRNPANPDAHRRTTALELLAQTEGRIDAFVAGIGTGGTITGVGQVLRAEVPGARIIGVEPAVSAVLNGRPPGLHRIQGIGAGFIPPVLDRSVLDEVRTITDEAAWACAQDLAKREGLLVGISSGANVAIACQVARELGPSSRVITILADTGERYFSMGSKFPT